jgi:hypothetical protein
MRRKCWRLTIRRVLQKGDCSSTGKAPSCAWILIPAIESWIILERKLPTGTQEMDGLLCMEILTHEVMEDTGDQQVSVSLSWLHTDALFP